MLIVASIPGKGRGVLTDTPITEGEIIEVSPVIVIPEKEMIGIRRTILGDYYFKWDREQKGGAIALGFGSLFNHSYQPNASFEVDLENEQIVFTALRNIQVNEEITTNYNGDPADPSRLWFNTIDD